MCKHKKFYFFPSNLYTFYFCVCVCVIALVGTSTTMLIKNNEKKHSSLMVVGKLLVFKMMLAIGSLAELLS